MQELVAGQGRSFGQRWAVTHLRYHHGYRARRDYVAAALKTVNPAGVASRQPGARRQRLENYITAGPDFL